MKRILSFPPLVFIGVISYSLYLWHWPLIVFNRYFSASDLSGTQTALVLISSLVMAFVSFEFIEAPFRGGDSPFTRQQIFAFGLAASALSLVLGVTIYARRGLPGRYDEATRQLMLSNTERREDFQEVCSHWKSKTFRPADIAFCTIGPVSSRKIMFWGDSQVQQLYPLIKKFHDEGEMRDHGAVFAIANGCPPSERLNSIEQGFHCDSMATLSMTRAEADDVDTVFIGFNTWWASHEYLCPSQDGRCVGSISPEEACHRVLLELSEHIRELKRRGKRVIVSLPFPMYDKSIPNLEIRNAVFGRLGLAGTAR